MRVLVTGSRDWPHSSIVRHALKEQYFKLAYTPNKKDEEFILIHGACPTGADYQAHAWIQGVLSQDIEDDEYQSIKEETYPADWNKYGKAAGPRRNDEMIASKPDLALVFFYNRSAGQSRGTQYTYNKILEHKIPHIIWELDDTHIGD